MYVVMITFDPEEDWNHVSVFETEEKAKSYYKKTVDEFKQHDRFIILEESDDCIKMVDDAPPFNKISVMVAKLESEMNI